MQAKHFDMKMADRKIRNVIFLLSIFLSAFPCPAQQQMMLQSQPVVAAAASAFSPDWQFLVRTEAPGDTFQIKCDTDTSLNVNIDWGDGAVSNNITDFVAQIHPYAVASNYIIGLNGSLDYLYIGDQSGVTDSHRLLTVATATNGLAMQQIVAALSTNLYSADLTGLDSVQRLDFNGCSKLTNAVVSGCSFLAGAYLDFTFNALDVSAVNQILARAVASTMTDGVIYLYEGANAAPTGQGMTDYATLTNEPGNEVLVNFP